MDKWVSQLLKNRARYETPLADSKGKRHLLFPWTGSFIEPKKCAWDDYWFACARGDKAAIIRCPIFRALGAEQKSEVILRGPKWSLTYGSYHWSLMHRALDFYEKSEIAGVSPITAMALLLPEPRLERRHGIPDVLVVPQSISAPDGRGSGGKHRVAEWHVVFWALKRYTTMSWRDLANLSTDLKRNATSFRQTIRVAVEKPLADYYKQLTGKDLPPDLYQAAVQEGPDSSPRAKAQMVELKRAAALRRRNPTN
jgi:hypothetical protein